MYSWIHSFREINKAKRPKLEELYRLEIPVVINKFIFIVFTAILQQGIGCMVRILLYIFLFLEPGSILEQWVRCYRASKMASRNA